MKVAVALSERLQAIVDMVPACAVTADIGCDHGKVAVALVQNGKARRVICGDISAGSLDKARKLTREYGLEDSISLRVGSGLSVLEAGEAGAAVIAGLGGMLIAQLLEYGADKAPDTLVLSPNRDAALLRQCLVTHGYRIEDETLVYENGHFYPVICAVKGESYALSDMEMEFGPVLLQKKPELLKRYLLRRIGETQKIRDKLLDTDSPRRLQLLGEADERLKKYAEVEKCL